MGNCLFNGLGAVSSSEGDEEQIEEMIKVVTSTGGIMELYAPITAECITKEFPGHALFPIDDNNDQDQQHLLRSLSRRQQRPLLHNEHLCGGNTYYLLPHGTAAEDVQPPQVVTSTPYRMSTLQNCYGHRDRLKASPAAFAAGTRTTTNKWRWSPNCTFDDHRTTCGDVHASRYYGPGVWKVRLVINPEQLAEILSHDNKTEELIDSIRTVAKCGTGISTTTATSVASSDLDQLSVSSGRY